MSIRPDYEKPCGCSGGPQYKRGTRLMVHSHGHSSTTQHASKRHHIQRGGNRRSEGKERTGEAGKEGETESMAFAHQGGHLSIERRRHRFVNVRKPLEVHVSSGAPQPGLVLSTSSYGEPYSSTVTGEEKLKNTRTNVHVAYNNQYTRPLRGEARTAIRESHERFLMEYYRAVTTKKRPQ